MKLFALFSNSGQPIASTCLCEKHFDKQSIVQVPVDAASKIWNRLLPLNTLKCIFCGATDATPHSVGELLDLHDKLSGNAPISLDHLEHVKAAHDALSEQLEDPEAQPHVTHDLAVRLCLALNSYYETL